VNAIRPCVLCRPDNPHTAAPGWYSCHHCADRLAGQLGDLADRYATLQEADELIPHGSGERGSPGFGPRSPAVDALLVHSDVRTKWTQETGFGALAFISEWAFTVRTETNASAPTGRVTMARELTTIRWNWDHLLQAGWLSDFADETSQVNYRLGALRREFARSVPIGNCPIIVDNEPCGTRLRARLDSDTIRCRTCSSEWHRSQWELLGAFIQRAS
jgi:hypothetical protein